MSSINAQADWPELPLAAWIDTRDTLHLWLQIVGKVRLRLTPPINHSWHSTFYLTARGLTTSPIPYDTRSFQIDLDFVDHRLHIAATDGASGGFALEPQSVAAFYARLMDELARIRMPVRILARPNELADATPFPRDETHRAYDKEAVHRFWLALSQADRVLKRFRTGFIGKCSPVHLFWGAMDLAVTRFSGRTAPVHAGGIPNLPDRVTREAYSHEVSSCGFWSGTAPVDYPAFYAYAYPQPEGFAAAQVAPDGAFYSADFGEFILPYDRVRDSADPDGTLMSFLQSTYAAAADLAKWDRRALERQAREGV
jgi:FAD/FMN-containing dehydrogenase